MHLNFCTVTFYQVAPYLFLICLDYVLRTSIDLMIENDLRLKKARSRRYHARTISDADYANDMALLANAPTQTESLLHSLEQAVGGDGSDLNADKKKYMYFNQSGISPQ